MLIMTPGHKEVKGFKGTLSNIELIDLLQMACLSKTSMKIKVEAEGKRGALYVLDGSIVHAEAGNKSGEAAFFEVMSWKGGRFGTQQLQEMPLNTIQKNWEFLLIEATRVKDETKEYENITTGDEFEGMRVLVVDDSRFVCKKMKEFLEKDPDIRVIGTALNGKEALEMMKKLTPDIITLDINMPVMSGDTTLKHIMIHAPCPVVIVSGINEDNISTVFDFLRLGAVDFIAKPQNIKELELQQDSLTKKIKVAAKARVKNFKRIKSPHVVGKKQPRPHPFLTANDKLVIVISMAGGCIDILKILPSIPHNLNASILMIPQIENGIFGSFVNHLDKISRIPVVTVEKGTETPLEKGKCYFAEPGCEIRVTKDNNRLAAASCSVPSTIFDTLRTLADSVLPAFESPENIIWVFLSGEEEPSDDLVELIGASGGLIISQDPSSALHPVLPGHYIENGYADIIVPPEKIPQKLTKIVGKYRVKMKPV